jgi:hypothetical protein
MQPPSIKPRPIIAKAIARILMADLAPKLSQKPPLPIPATS